jgi:hypothetical protein
VAHHLDDATVAGGDHRQPRRLALDHHVGDALLVAVTPHDRHVNQDVGLFHARAHALVIRGADELHPVLEPQLAGGAAQALEVLALPHHVEPHVTAAGGQVRQGLEGVAVTFLLDQPPDHQGAKRSVGIALAAIDRRKTLQVGAAPDHRHPLRVGAERQSLLPQVVGDADHLVGGVEEHPVEPVELGHGRLHTQIAPTEGDHHGNAQVLLHQQHPQSGPAEVCVDQVGRIGALQVSGRQQRQAGLGRVAHREAHQPRNRKPVQVLDTIADHHVLDVVSQLRDQLVDERLAPRQVGGELALQDR